MTKETSITTFAVNNNWLLDRLITSVPSEGLDAATYYFKANKFTADSAAVITKAITTSHVAGAGLIYTPGQSYVDYLGVTRVVGANEAFLRFEFTPTDTNKLTAYGQYAYTLLLHTPSGLLNTPEVGTIVPLG